MSQAQNGLSVPRQRANVRPADLEKGYGPPDEHRIDSDNSHNTLAPGDTPYSNNQNLQRSTSHPSRPPTPNDYGAPPTKHHHMHMPDTEGMYRFWDRFRGHGRRKVGVVESLKNIAFSSWLNVFLVFIPIAWVAHYSYRIGSDPHPWSEGLIFALCFLAIIPLEKLFDFGGEQMSLYLGKDLGDLLIITLNNAVEATLAIILLLKCELRLLQATIIGVVVLHLLLIPGTAFITGGARVWEQNLHPHLTQLNHTLLTIGVLTLLLPAAFFAALGGSTPAESASAAANTTEHLVSRAVAHITPENLVSDSTRSSFLAISHGLAIILLLIYICSRIFLHNPPGEDNAARVHPLAPEEIKHEERKLATTDPEVNVWVCIVMLTIAIALMAITAEFLVESVEFVKTEGRVLEEWFGLILLPIVSFAADGAVAVVFFGRYALRLFLGTPEPPHTLAKARAIDLSIQFTLFWMPFLVLLGWWTSRPFLLLFDLFEVALLLGACFLVNYVTADAKTNWAEGAVLVAFYTMIALVSWYYPGQPALHEMLVCRGTVAEAMAAASSGEGAEHAARSLLL